MTDLEQFTAGFFEALAFTDLGPDSDIPEGAELDPELVADLEADCRSFFWRFDWHVRIVMDVNRRLSWADAGHDFWLTRNGHGAGFWDGDWDLDDTDRHAAKLDQAAQDFGQVDLYEVDGVIYA